MKATSTVEPAAARPNTVLSLQDICVGYGKVPVISGLSFEVAEGEVVALLGANGAGKTTTLKAVVGELPLSGGVLEYDGARPAKWMHERCRNGISYVPEERSAVYGLSVHDNLRLARCDIDDALSLFPELAPLLKRRAGLLSGGEQQILAVARALARNPRLLVADELSLGLAPLVVERLLRAIGDAAQSRGIGVLLVEQQIASAMAVADRVIVLHRGTLVLEGTAAELRGRIDEIRERYLAG